MTDAIEASSGEVYRPSSIETRRGVALCLSGGGYRAALFHLGALRRMNELGALAKVTAISSVSGGSIVSAFLATRLDPWPTQARDPRFEAFARDLLQLASTNIRELPSFRWVERAYRQLIGKQRLKDLPGGGPEFTFCATDMANGVNWVFERRDLGRGGKEWAAGSYRAGYASADELPLARAVAASSAFPPVLGPVDLPFAAEDYRYGDEDGTREHVRLTDGGVYDNLALEPVWKEAATVLVSDGGATMDTMPYEPRRPWMKFARYMGLANGQGTSVRKRWLIASYSRDDGYGYRGTYWGVGSHPSRFGEDFADVYEEKLVDNLISETRTDLDAFSEPEASVLQNHGYLNCDAALRKWTPHLVTEEAPLAPPSPEWLEPKAVEAELRRQRVTKRVLPFGRRPFRPRRHHDDRKFRALGLSARIFSMESSPRLDQEVRRLGVPSPSAARRPALIPVAPKSAR